MVTLFLLLTFFSVLHLYFTFNKFYEANKPAKTVVTLQNPPIVIINWYKTAIVSYLCESLVFVCVFGRSTVRKNVRSLNSELMDLLSFNPAIP